MEGGMILNAPILPLSPAALVAGHMAPCLQVPLKAGTGFRECSVYMCTCCTMQHTWETLGSMDTSQMFSDDDQWRQLPFCQHSVAVQQLHETESLAYAAIAEEGACSRIGDLEFCCHTQPIAIIRSSPPGARRHKLLLSCDFGDGKPFESSRGIIRTEGGHFQCCTCPAACRYSCDEHIKPLAAWLEGNESVGDVCLSLPLYAPADQLKSESSMLSTLTSMRPQRVFPICPSTCASAMTFSYSVHKSIRSLILQHGCLAT
jgi:hypothetical protein